MKLIRNIVLIMGVSSILMAPAIAIPNPTDDPDLKKAMTYDSELNGGNRKISSQGLAEKHYLAYLPREKDPKIRSQIYTQLGVLFNTNWHKEKGEKPDYPKARKYFSLALEETPTWFSKSTIRARYGKIAPDIDTKTRFEYRIEAHKWLLANLEKGIPDASLKKLAENIQESGCENMIVGALAMENSKDALQRLCDIFEGYQVAKRAQEELTKLSPTVEINQVVEVSQVDSAVSSSTLEAGNDSPVTDSQLSEENVAGKDDEPTLMKTPAFTYLPAVLLLAGILIIGSIVIKLRKKEGKRKVGDIPHY